MASIQKIEANRKNAKRSTGPKTSEGKAASSRNALSTGIYAAGESVLPHEDPRDLERLTREYYDRFSPSTPEERCLVDSLVSDEWMLRRFRRIEGEILTDSIKDHARFFEDEQSLSTAYCGSDRALERLQRRINAFRKAYLKTLEALCDLQANHPPTPPPSKSEPVQLAPISAPVTSDDSKLPLAVGFVPSNCARVPTTVNPPSSATMKTCPPTSMESSPRS